MFSFYLFEIKNRLILVLIFLCNTCFSIYFKKDTILSYFFVLNFSTNKNVSHNLNNLISEKFSCFLVTQLSELFLVYIELMMFISLKILIIFFCYHVICFFVCGFKVNEKTFIKVMFKNVLKTFLFSMIFTNYYFFPTFCLIFFDMFENSLFSKSFFNLETKLINYVEFYVTVYELLFYSFLLIFSFSSFCKKESVLIIAVNRKFIFLGFLVTATIITPPDVIIQCILCNFMIFFIELKIFYELFFMNFNSLEKFKAAS